MPCSGGFAVPGPRARLGGHVQTNSGKLMLPMFYRDAGWRSLESRGSGPVAEQARAGHIPGGTVVAFECCPENSFDFFEDERQLPHSNCNSNRLRRSIPSHLPHLPISPSPHLHASMQDAGNRAQPLVSPFFRRCGHSLFQPDCARIPRQLLWTLSALQSLCQPVCPPGLDFGPLHCTARCAAGTAPLERRSEAERRGDRGGPGMPAPRIPQPSFCSNLVLALADSADPRVPSQQSARALSSRGAGKSTVFHQPTSIRPPSTQSAARCAAVRTVLCIPQQRCGFCESHACRPKHTLLQTVTSSARSRCAGRHAVEASICAPHDRANRPTDSPEPTRVKQTAAISLGAPTRWRQRGFPPPVLCLSWTVATVGSGMLSP